LGELCCFQQGNDAFFFLTAGPAIDEELKPVGEDTPRDAAAEPEEYVMEPMARKMLAEDPALKAAFDKRLREDKAFAADPQAR
ncbi:hypothetical protein, partial [Pseudomonas aeruginosa]|uniref:hypothetical protein n=1 Tax=Pseudomonas aeruginosa TaxID=287 RepID=UPI0029553FD5